MSCQSNICNALCIFFQKLVKCNKSTGNTFCDDHMIKYKNKDNCPICFETVDGTNEIPLNCGHWFHKECLKPTNIHKCPLCKKNIDETEIKYIFGENHIERNNYNDGRSIYYNYQEIDENAYAEFGHGEFLDDDIDSDYDTDSDDESDERFNEFDEDTRINLLDWNDIDLPMEEIHTRINRISEEGWEQIANEIARNCEESEIFTDNTILSYTNLLINDDNDYKNKSTEFINEFINFSLSINNNINENNILEFYWCNRTIMASYMKFVTYNLSSFGRMMRIMYNLNNINSPHIDVISQIKNLIKFNFLNIIRKLERTNDCPPYIRRQMERLNIN